MTTMTIKAVKTEAILYVDFLEELGRMKDAEQKLALALPLVAKAAHARNLRELVEAHREETKGHAKSIQLIADTLGEKLPQKASHAMNGFLEGTVKTLVREIASPDLDQSLIAAAQKIEHFEIAAYGTLCAWAKQLDHPHEFALLNSILNQEKLADALLTEVAKGPTPLSELVMQSTVRKLQRVAEAQPQS